MKQTGNDSCLESQALGLVDNTVIYLNPWGSHSTSLSITFLTSKTEVKRDTPPRSISEAMVKPHMKLFVSRAFWGT